MSRIKLKHGVLAESEAFVDLTMSDFRAAGPAKDTLCLVVRSVHRRVERGVALVDSTHIDIAEGASGE